MKNTKKFNFKFKDLSRTLEEDSFKSFIQASKFYWNQTLKPLESSRTLINRRFIGVKPKSLKSFNTQASNTKNIQRTQRTKNFLNKLRLRSSSSTQFDLRNTLLEALESKSHLKRRIKGIFLLLYYKKHEIVFYHFKSINICYKLFSVNSRLEILFSKVLFCSVYIIWLLASQLS